MVSDKHLINRIPFEELTEVSSWQLPNLGKNGKIVPSVKKDEKKRGDNKVKTKPAEAKAASKPADVLVEEVSDGPIAPLTAQQLKEITDTAEQEAREQGYKSGFEEGMKQGEKKGAELGEQKAYRETKLQLTEKSQAFAALAEALFQPVNGHNAELENTVLTMAVELAKHFIHSELSINPSLMFATVEQAVASLPAGAKGVCVYVNPQDLVYIEEEFASKKGVWQFVGDAKIKRGGCKVESQTSTVDFTFERRINDWQMALRTNKDKTEPSQPPQDFRPAQEPPAAEAESAYVSEPELNANSGEHTPHHNDEPNRGADQVSQAPTPDLGHADLDLPNPAEGDTSSVSLQDEAQGDPKATPNKRENSISADTGKANDHGNDSSV